MNRREFIKATGAALAAVGLPHLPREEVLTVDKVRRAVADLNTLKPVDYVAPIHYKNEFDIWNSGHLTLDQQ